MGGTELSEQLRDLKVHYVNERFVGETITQLKKDLNSAGLEMPEDLNAAEEVRNYLELLAAQLLEDNTERLFNLLYRIDLPESEIAAYLHPDHDGVPAVDIAQAILDREMKKVVIRNYIAERGI